MLLKTAARQYDLLGLARIRSMRGSPERCGRRSATCWRSGSSHRSAGMPMPVTTSVSPRTGFTSCCSGMIRWPPGTGDPEINRRIAIDRRAAMRTRIQIVLGAQRIAVSVGCVPATAVADRFLDEDPPVFVIVESSWLFI